MTDESRGRNRFVVALIILAMAAPLLLVVANPDAAGFLLLVSIPLGLLILFGWMFVRSFTDRGRVR